MGELPLSFEQFVRWLCEREHAIVGYPGVWLNDPLAEWISSLAGRVWGTDDKFYGPASYDTRLWAWLPRWAYLFKLWSEKHAYRPMTGEQAFTILAVIEQRHGALA